MSPFFVSSWCVNVIRVFLHDDTLHELEGLNVSGTFLVLQHQQNIGRIFGTSKMHLSPRWIRLLSILRGGSFVVDFLFIVTPIVGACNCFMFCCMLLYVLSSIAIISMGKRELAALLNLSSCCLVMVEWLFHGVTWGKLVPCYRLN